MSGESRVDLLNWVNDLLNLNYTKVEQLGSGAAYCQIMDSIYLDVPMARVKFDTTKEYEYLNNFKVLQSSFVKHKITKTIPVDRLIKCKFQDNLEFFQWIRKYWKENKDESDYDPNSRRKYMPPASASATPARSSASSTTGTTGQRTRATATRRVTSNSSVSGNPTSSTLSIGRTRGSTPASGASSRTSSRVSSLNQNSINKELENELSLTKSSLNEVSIELEEYKNAVEALETERNFYFNKLREIEILTETTSDSLKANEQTEDLNLKDILIKIQEILYNTEEGFQVPDDIEVNDINAEINHEINPDINHDINMEEETF